MDRIIVSHNNGGGCVYAIAKVFMWTFFVWLAVCLIRLVVE